MRSDWKDLELLDKRYLWHPFTPMEEWIAAEHHPLVLVSGDGVWLTDTHGNKYLDGNSSIWTNIHGHNHPTINQAINQQLRLVAHTSFLGFSNPPAVRLAEKLVRLLGDSSLTRVFYSDDGATGIEVAIKMTWQYFSQNGLPQKTVFAAFQNAYHGDTLGASSLGGIVQFHDRFARHHFPVERLTAVQDLDRLAGEKTAAIIIEPLIQGVAGMQPWPPGMLRSLRDWCDQHGAFLIFDEVMTGFGRTGKMFAFQHEGVYPDFLVLAKGLSGGYLPLAATITSERVFNGFLGAAEQMRTFFYGHSYTGNALGCAAALASLQLFESEGTLAKLPEKIEHLARGLDRLRENRWIRETRQCGMIAGIEVGRPDRTFDPRERIGARICVAARKWRLLTRPIQDTIVFMPPLCVSESEIDLGLEAIERATEEVCDRSEGVG
ncbi:MAG TPA: adenosylmethionine--8-amino-7-oxononanoate transaminase [Chthoniobacterales bacterium]|nr:adenosylmethionine--8-amino-7-oxononanoate transaminase [Chthoniobacterales bacterium]